MNVPRTDDGGETPKAARRSFLVFESVDATNAGLVQHPVRPGARGETVRPAQLYGYECIAAVSAVDEDHAARAVIGVTRRLSKLAVIQAVFIDFAADVNEPETVLLNP